MAPETGYAWLCQQILQIERYSTRKVRTVMEKYRCTICDYVYDPAVGDPETGIPAGTKFQDLPDDWLCPLCAVPKSEFVKE